MMGMQNQGRLGRQGKPPFPVTRPVGSTESLGSRAGHLTGRRWQIVGESAPVD